MVFRVSAVALFFSCLVTNHASADECGRQAFTAVVAKASGDLTAMNDANKKRFQKKLLRLKTSKGWSDADYMENAKSFIQDEQIASFDAGTKALLTRVSQLGAPSDKPAASLAGVAPSFTDPADGSCAMVEELRRLMAKVVENNRAKWVYMFRKVDAALDGAGQETGATQ